MKRKLLLVINHMDWFWSHRFPLAKAAKDAGWDVVVAATGADKDSALHEAGFKGISLTDLESTNSPIAVSRVLRQLNRILKEEKPTLMHAITVKYAFLTGLISKLNKEVAVVHTIAGVGYLFSGKFKPNVLRALVTPLIKVAFSNRESRLIFQNSDDRQTFIDLNYIKPEQGIVIRSSGVDLTSFTAVPEPDGIPTVVMSGRLLHDKGFAVFVEAARKVHQRGMAVNFKIAGRLMPDAPGAISPKEMDAILDRSPVEWLGHVDDMPAFFANSHLMLYPSHYREGVPKVVIEAAATGRAIITTDYIGCREALVDGRNGISIPVKDPEAAANAVEKLLKNPELRKRMGGESRKLMEEEFDVNVVVKRTLALYDKVCAERGSEPLLSN
ncbi:MAG: glycosyltransferase family 4 protein [Verrucomicrobiota bacterium]